MQPFNQVLGKILNTKFTEFQQRVEATLAKFLQQISDDNPIKPAIQYATLNPGKRVRPALLYAVAEGFGEDLSKVDVLAAAIELVHSYSLVHDDLPAMDNDDLRRGLPTCHKKFDEATAILTGDAQLTLAFELISQAENLSDAGKVRAIKILSSAAGINGMIFGQAIDIAAENLEISLEQLTKLHNLKTGALIIAALKLGAPDSEDDKTLENLGQALGLAFQIQDDILDIEGDSELLGKNQGRDEELNKSTFPKLLGLEEAKNLRDKLIARAEQEHQNLPFYSDFLAKFIQFVGSRDH